MFSLILHQNMNFNCPIETIWAQLSKARNHLSAIEQSTIEPEWTLLNPFEPYWTHLNCPWCVYQTAINVHNKLLETPAISTHTHTLAQKSLCDCISCVAIPEMVQDFWVSHRLKLPLQGCTEKQMADVLQCISTLFWHVTKKKQPAPFSSFMNVFPSSSVQCRIVELNWCASCVKIPSADPA